MWATLVTILLHVSAGGSHVHYSPGGGGELGPAGQPGRPSEEEHSLCGDHSLLTGGVFGGGGGRGGRGACVVCGCDSNSLVSCRYQLLTFDMCPR